MKKKYFLIIVLSLLLTSLKIFAQNDVNAIIAKDSAIEAQRPREKLYLHFDKSTYITGDTIWFAAYLTDALTGKPSRKSAIVYVELFDGNNEFLSRIALKTVAGTSFGQVPTGKDIKEGIYHLRAYTNWMQNFGDTLFFQKDIPVVGGGENWLLQISQPKVYSDSGRDSVQYSFVLNDNEGRLLKYREVGVVIKNKKGKNLISGSVTTDAKGSADVNFYLPKGDVDEGLSLQLLDMDHKKDIVRISTPLVLNPDSNIDIQFLPESGHLVAGLPNRIAFKALNVLGKPVNVKGFICKSNGDTVAAFKAVHNGMGYFMLTPETDEQYIATVQYNGISMQQVSLPVVENSGTIISVDPNSGDNISLDLLGTDDLFNQSYYVLGRAKGYVFWAAEITLTQNDTHTTIAKKTFPSGVGNFQLYKADGQLVNERAFFVNNHDALKISFETSAKNYTKDSIPLDIKVTDAAGDPVQGIFSLAITDDKQVHKNIAGSDNILSYMLLTSDLAGKIEAPGYYFSGESPDAAQALDALMLTQGFVKYNWENTAMNFLPEPQFLIRGKVINAFNRPLKNANIAALSMDPEFRLFKDTTSDAAGNFSIANIPDFDTAAFFVQVRNKKNNIIVGSKMELNRFKAAGMPGYAVAETNTVNINPGNAVQNALLARADYMTAYGTVNGHLADVTVYAKTPVAGSKNLNGPGGYDEAVSMSELQQMGNATLSNVLRKRFPEIWFDANTGTYRYEGAEMVFIFDGIPYNGGANISGIIPIDQYFDTYQASDIKGMEFMETDSRFAQKYKQYYMTKIEDMQKRYAFMEITTYRGNGPYTKVSPGTEIYRPQPFSFGKVMYQPRYINYENAATKLPDLRSTICWLPGIVTDKNGKAQLYFYSAQTPSAYTLWIEGTGLNGSFGVAEQQINIVAHP